MRLKVYDEENGNHKNITKEIINIDTIFDPDSMEIKLRDNKIYYSKKSHNESLRVDVKGTLRRIYRGHFKKIPKIYKNHYIDDFYDNIIISLLENLSLIF